MGAGLALGARGEAPRAMRAAALAALVVFAHAVLIDAGRPARAPAPRPAPAPVQVVLPRSAPPLVTDAPAQAPTTQPTPPRTTPPRERRFSPWPQHPPRAAQQSQWPAEPTKLPPSFDASYRVRRGTLTGEAALHWQREGSTYTAALAARLDAQRLFDWTSRGALDAHGVAPERFVAVGRRGQAAAANFQRGAGKITYAGPDVQHPLPPAAQDRLSALIQVAGIVAATPERFAAPGAQIALFVSGARGDAEVWVFDSRGAVPLPAQGAGGAGRTALHLVREATRPYDQRVELWLDPAGAQAPLRLRFVTSGREHEALELDRLGP